MDETDSKVNVDKNYALTKWNYKDYVWCLRERLPWLLRTKRWHYLLCSKEPPVFMHGQKNFKLCRPEKPITTPQKRKQLTDFLEKGKTIPGFPCTATLQDLDRADVLNVNLTYSYLPKWKLYDEQEKKEYKLLKHDKENHQFIYELTTDSNTH